MKQSRLEKHRRQRRVDGEATLFWGLGFIFCLLVLAIEFFVDIPAAAHWLLEMEMALFSASFTLLAFYLLGLTFVFSRQEIEGKINHHVIIYVWLGTILYHLFLLITEVSNPHVYKAGIILFLGPLFLTVFHFTMYLSVLRKSRQDERAALLASRERVAYQYILEGSKVYHEIKRITEGNPEVEQMLVANGFHIKLERFFIEMQQYLPQDQFSAKDVEQLEAHLLFLENILDVVKQHPGVMESRLFSRRDDERKEE